MGIIHVNKKNFQEAVQSAGGKILLDFWAPWCGPCRMVSPVLDEIARERQDVTVCKINIDEELELANKFRIMSIPTLLVMEDGEVRRRAIGAKPKAAILSML